ncbi:MAG: transcriptional regulator, AraC family [Paenibacillaceae bacterium]|jgi:AraC-like DNA-binding protein|nr:transcriptional regulator, AraC family [Paenibacillaceae bacterium]
MTVKWSIGELHGSYFFEPDSLIFVNRAVETFELVEHRHDFVELTYVFEGSGVHYINGEAIAVSRGDVFFLPVGVSHVFRPSTPKKDRQLIVYNCVLDLKYMASLPDVFPESADILSLFSSSSAVWLQTRDTGEFLPLFMELHREYAGKPPGYRSLLTALVVRIFIGLYRKANTAAGADGAWSPVHQTIAHMEAHYRSNELSLEKLAELSKLSGRQFSRLFQKQTGMSYLAYLHHLRIDAACRLLKASSDTVSSIASSVGYTDMKFFHRLFKRTTGLTPGQYRTGSAAEGAGSP